MVYVKLLYDVERSVERVHGLFRKLPVIRMSRFSPEELRFAIKAEASRLGFESLGITSPDPPPHLDVYMKWIERGRHGSMSYLASERALKRRADPREILPGCESILVCATRYPPARMEPGGTPRQVRVAGYARGLDYHDVLLERMQQLIEFIQSLVGAAFSYQLYTDTGPVLERELAMRAGLGWIGKNTCLIQPEIGSYTLLSEAFLGIRLPLDQPFTKDFCGKCSRCMEACPTRCIRPDRTIDARRCISYLTIENKGAIPPDLREKVGEWLFGCDICQAACPWNRRFARPTEDDAFRPRPYLDPPDLTRLLSLRPREWRTDLMHSPLERPRRRGLLRNSCVVAGNMDDPGTLPALLKLLQSDPEPVVRSHAAWAIGQIDGPGGVEGLVEARGREQDPHVLLEIDAALSRLPPANSDRNETAP
jgi:epoxyqueuosine reductase